MGEKGGVRWRENKTNSDACWAEFASLWNILLTLSIIVCTWLHVDWWIRYFRVHISCDCHEAWLAEGCGCRWMAPWMGSSPLVVYRKFAERRNPTIKLHACKLPETGTPLPKHMHPRSLSRLNFKGTLHNNNIRASLRLPSAKHQIETCEGRWNSISISIPKDFVIYILLWFQAPKLGLVGCRKSAEEEFAAFGGLSKRWGPSRNKIAFWLHFDLDQSPSQISEVSCKGPEKFSLSCLWPSQMLKVSLTSIPTPR